MSGSRTILKVFSLTGSSVPPVFFSIYNLLQGPNRGAIQANRGAVKANRNAFGPIPNYKKSFECRTFSYEFQNRRFPS